MYFYDLTFDDNKIVFPEYWIGQIVVLNDDFTIADTIFEENNYGCLILGVYAKPDEYIFAIRNSRVIRKYIKRNNLFVDVEIKNLPKDAMVCFNHNDIFVQKDKIIIITQDNDILVADLTFTEVKYVKRIQKGKQHMQIAEDTEFLYIPIEKIIFRLSKSNLDINVYAQFDQTIDVLIRNKNGLWSLTNDAQLTNVDAGGQPIDLSTYIHFYGNRAQGQIYNYINAYSYKEKVLFVPCYCDNLLLFDMMSNQITELVIEKEIENDRTLSREHRRNTLKYIASCQNGQYVFLLSSSSEILYSFNFETFLLTECAKGINDKLLIEIELAHKSILNEQFSGINLTSYIDLIIKR